MIRSNSKLEIISRPHLIPYPSTFPLRFSAQEPFDSQYSFQLLSYFPCGESFISTAKAGKGHDALKQSHSNPYHVPITCRSSAVHLPFICRFLESVQPTISEVCSEPVGFCSPDLNLNSFCDQSKIISSRFRNIRLALSRYR